MEFLDTTALATALPTMAGHFGVRAETLKLALTTYVLALAVFMPASTWLADRFGPKRVYLGALALFCTGSLACAMSDSLPALIAARALQGLGGALMAPVGRTIILHATPKAELVSAMNWFTMPAQLGPLLGAPLAGLILEITDWRWIFLINLPIGVLGAMAVARFVPNERMSRASDFDLRGYVLAASAIILFVGAAEVASMHAWSLTLAGALGGAAITGALYLRHARRTAHPVLNVQLFADPTYRISMLAGTLARCAVGASPLLLPLLLQVGFGWSPLQAGMVLMGLALGTLLAKAVSTTMIRLFSLRSVLIAASLTAAALNMVPALFSVLTPMWTVFLVMIATGVARSTQFTINNTMAFANLENSQLSSASTLASVVQQVGHALGISLGGLLLAAQVTQQETLTASDFTMPFVMVGLVGATAAIAYSRLHSRAGENMRGRQRTAA